MGAVSSESKYLSGMFFPVRKRLGIQFAAYEVENKNFEIHLVQLKHIDLTWGQAQF